MRAADHETPVWPISSGEADPVQSVHHPRHREYLIFNFFVFPFSLQLPPATQVSGKAHHNVSASVET